MKTKPGSTLASRPRPDSNRPLEAPLLSFDLHSLTERIKKEDDWKTGNHNAITLVKNAGMRIVLIAMHKGNKIKMHFSEGEVCVHILEGQLEFNNGKKSMVLGKAQILALHEDIKYELVAVRATTFLLTMTNVKSNEERIF